MKKRNNSKKKTEIEIVSAQDEFGLKDSKVNRRIQEKRNIKFFWTYAFVLFASALALIILSEFLQSAVLKEQGIDVNTDAAYINIQERYQETKKELDEKIKEFDILNNAYEELAEKNINLRIDTEILFKLTEINKLLYENKRNAVSNSKKIFETIDINLVSKEVYPSYEVARKRLGIKATDKNTKKFD